MTSELTPAEAAVEDAIRAASGWRGIDTPPGSRRARIVLDAVRPLILAEAAATLRKLTVSRPGRPLLRSRTRSDHEVEADHQRRIAYAEGMAAGIRIAADHLASLETDPTAGDTDD